MEERDFGWALRMLKSGKRVARSGWNGKGMYIFYVQGKTDRVTIDPSITMYTAGKTLQPGWLASQADMLATDWDEAPSEKQTRLELPDE